MGESSEAPKARDDIARMNPLTVLLGLGDLYGVYVVQCRTDDTGLVARGGVTDQALVSEEKR